MTSFLVRAVPAFALALFAAGSALAQRAPVVAMVTDVQGTVTIVRGGTAIQPALATELSPAMRLELKDGARIVLLELASGDELRISGPSSAEVRAGGIEATPREKLARKSTKVGPVKVREGGLTQAAIVLRATQQIERLPLLTLASTTTLETRPLFRWATVEGVGPYRFELTDDKGGLVLETRTESSELRLPEAVALAHGRSYTWEVSARRSDGVRFSSFGDFSVASRELVARAAELRPAAGAGLSDWVAYALWADGQSLADEARAVWRQLAKERPDDPMVKALAGP